MTHLSRKTKYAPDKNERKFLPSPKGCQLLLPCIEVNQMYKTFSVGEKGFREDLRKVLKQARSSEVDVAEVEALVAKYEKEQVGGVDLQKYDTWREKIRQVREIESCGISYMGRCGNLVYELAQEKTYIVFVLNASNDCSEEAKNSQLFFRKIQKTYKEDPSFNFYWADTDLITPSSWRGDKNKIIQYIGGKEISKNAFEDFKERRLQYVNYGRLLVL